MGATFAAVIRLISLVLIMSAKPFLVTLG